MRGAPENIAKAVVIAALRAAHAAGRGCRLIAFGGPGELLERDLGRGAAGLDALAVDALHMLPFTTADRAQDLVWNQEALALALASPQPDARRWEASLRNNIGITLNDLGRHAEALTMLQQALAALQQQAAPAGRQRIGHWMVANTLRRLGRIDEALAIQQRLEAENAADGTPDAYVFEELALLHRARGDTAQADAYAARATLR